MIDRDENDWLAAQYALGALAPGERKMVKTRLLRDPALTGLVQDWEKRLAPLSLLEPGLPPPPRALEGILAAVAQQSVADQGGRATVQPLVRAARWRVARPALAATIAAIAIAIGAVLLDRHVQPADVLTAKLVPEVSSPVADEPRTSTGAAFTLSFDVQANAVTVRQTAGDPARADRVHVLWLQPDGAADAILIGQLIGSEPTVTRVGDLADHQMSRGRLIITLESPGIDSRPRGPVLASGRLQRSR